MLALPVSLSSPVACTTSLFASKGPRNSQQLYRFTTCPFEHCAQKRAIAAVTEEPFCLGPVLFFVFSSVSRHFPLNPCGRVR